MLALEDGRLLVRAARKSIAFFMASNSPISEPCPKKELREMHGVFVTLQAFPAHELRGCIGYPEPMRALWQAVLECAVSAAFSDPRFPPLTASELEKIVVEVSVLTKPELVEIGWGKGGAEQYLKKIKVGEDGLIAEGGRNRGLLLPQVAPEWGWDAEEFLQHTCMKAGLPAGAWKEKETKIYRFRAQIFREEKPKGEVVEGKE